MTTHEHITHDGSSIRRYFVMGALMSSLVACAAAAPKEGIVAKGPPGPPVGTEASTTQGLPPPPPPTSSALPSDNLPPKPISDITPKLDAEVGEGGGMGYRENPNEVDGDADTWSLTVSITRKRAPAPAHAAAPAPPKVALTARGAARSDLPATEEAADPMASTGSSATGGKPGTVGAASEVRGSIDKAEIHRVIRTHIKEVKQCYDQGLERDPALEGIVNFKITIGRTGSVASASKQDSTLRDRLVEQCIQKAVKGWTFPKPTGEGDVTVVYPFILKTTD